VAALVFFGGFLVYLEKTTQWKVFKYLPPVVILYLGTMLLCTAGAWNLQATKPTYSFLKNNILYAMVFLMLLRCDIRRVMKLGGRMIGGFFAASISIGIGFIGAHAIMHNVLGPNSWKSLGALCGSWMGGSGNMIAVQAALNVSTADMAYALLIDSVDYSFWVMFLLWAINFAPKFNAWTHANTSALDEVCARLEQVEEEEDKEVSFASILFLLGLGFAASAISQNLGSLISTAAPILDKGTWTVLIVTIMGLVIAVTPLAKTPGSSEMSSVLLYTVIALLASRASFADLKSAPEWILTGFMVLAIHAIVLLILAKIFKLDMFTCGVASLANIGGTASAPILAGSYSNALVPVGILMALMGYVIGTGGGLIVAHIMSMI
jgi:uncharacterized membrane protein